MEFERYDSSWKQSRTLQPSVNGRNADATHNVGCAATRELPRISCLLAGWASFRLFAPVGLIRIHRDLPGVARFARREKLEKADGIRFQPWLLERTSIFHSRRRLDGPTIGY